VKQKDIASLILIAGVAAVFSFLASKVLFKGAFQKVSVPVVEPLSSDFPSVRNDPLYKPIFFEGALDPTQLIQIGDNHNDAPFNGQ
jgi:hypothetical protein